MGIIDNYMCVLRLRQSTVTTTVRSIAAQNSSAVVSYTGAMQLLVVELAHSESYTSA